MRIALGTALNLLGLAAPLPVALWAIPDLLSSLRAERFTWLSILWALSAYSGVLDLGVARALTQHLATELARSAVPQRVGSLCATAMMLIGLLGLVLGAGLVLSAGPLVTWLGSPDHQQEAQSAVAVLACAVPAMLLGAAGRGVLEALLAFGRINAVRVPAGILTVLGPWSAVMQGGSLVDVAWVLVAIRTAAMVAWVGLAWRAMPAWRAHPAGSRQWLRPLLRSGSWLTVGNLVGPLMGYLDRFMVAALLTVTAAAHYVAPQEIVSKLWILPGALMAVLFPTFAAQILTRSRDVERIGAQAMHWIILVCLPLCLALALFSTEIISQWLGSDFAVHAARVLAWMAWGMFWGCVAQLPFTLLQSGDAAALTAKLHVAELLVFVVALGAVVPGAGVEGAAAVWAIRCFIDAGCLFLLCRMRFPDLRPWSGASLLALVLSSTLMFAGSWLSSVELRAAWCLLCIGLMCWFARRRPAMFRSERR